MEENTQERVEIIRFIDEDVEDNYHTTIIGAILNSLNLITGTSFVGIPYAMKQSGLVVGLIVLGILCWLTDISHQLLIECSKFHPILHKQDINSYEDLVFFPYGKRGENVLMFSVFALSFGASVGFLVMIKDTLPIILAFEQRNIVLLFVWMIFIVPLTFLKNLTSLDYVSGVSLILTAFLMYVMINECPVRESIDTHGGLIPLIEEYAFRPNIFATTSIFVDAIAWQHGSFTVFNTIKNPTLSRWRRVTAIVNSLAGVAHASIGFLGYVGYLDDTQGTIFLNLPYNNVCNLARAFFAFVVVMTYPIEMMIARDVASSFIRRNKMAEVNSQLQESLDVSCWRKYFIDGREMMIVMTLNTATLVLAMIMTDLGVVLTYTGALGGSIACFIMPGAVYIGVNGADFLQYTRSLYSSADINNENNNTQFIDSGHGSKPWWFRILGFPIWWRLASIGRENIEVNLKNVSTTSDCLLHIEEEGSDDTISQTQIGITLAQPTVGRFITSTLLIIFGIVNMAASLVQGTR